MFKVIECTITHFPWNTMKQSFITLPMRELDDNPTHVTTMIHIDHYSPLVPTIRQLQQANYHWLILS